MMKPGICSGCENPLEPQDAFCSHCGLTTGQIEWTFSDAPQPGLASLALRPGQRFFVIANNIGQASMRVQIETDRAGGVELEGNAQTWVEPGRWEVFTLRHRNPEALGGRITAVSYDAAREKWWERSSRRTTQLSFSGRVRVAGEQWILGSPSIVFPPGVRRQHVRVWNDSDRERAFEAESPIGYGLLNLSSPVDRVAPRVSPGSSLDLILQSIPTGLGSKPDIEWRPGPDNAPISLVRLPETARTPGPDVIVGIDFGTRNTGVRVRWRRKLTTTKPEGTVDVVGDKQGMARFPTEMVLHRNERLFLWGSEAALFIDGNRLSRDEVAVENLKTDLREGVERYTAIQPAWTNAEVLGRYFERLFDRLDDYFRQADPSFPLTRKSLNIRYVLTRPVLDANEGDLKGHHYQEALLAAMARCGVSESEITFLHEPVAAAIGIARRREQELLAMDGEVVAVVDAGGGTTDIALARVRLQNGRIDLELLGSYALHLEADNPALPALEAFRQQDRIEIGGNLIDSALTYRLLTNAQDLLENDYGDVPDRILGDLSKVSSEEQEGALRDFRNICRRMKERFAVASTQYLNRPQGTPPQEGEILPFPNRPEFAGVRLEQDLFDRFLLAPILDPIVGILNQQIGMAQSSANPVRASQIRRVYYVGGTNIDPVVRLRFGRAFPLAPAENDAGAQSEARREERLHAVVEGAVWSEEQLFAPSPLSLAVVMGDQEKKLIDEGAPVLPNAIALRQFLTVVLAPDQNPELDVQLIAWGTGMPEKTCVARAFYRNETGETQQVNLHLSVNREQGAVAALLFDSGFSEHERALWRFALIREQG